MSEITASKAEFALALQEAGLDVVPYVPGRVVPPVVIIRSSAPYLSTSSVSREYLLGLELICVAMTADNELATESLDQLIEDVVNALPSYATFKGVGEPYTLDVNNAQYLAASLTTDLSITL